MRLDQYKVVRALLLFRDRLNQFDSKKREPIIKMLQAFNFLPDDDEQDLPDLATISATTGVPKPKVSKLIKEIYTDLTHSFTQSPIELTRCSYVLFIHVPWDEFKGYKNREYVEEHKRMHIWCEIRNGIIPRIGEEVSLDFIDESKFNHGYVHNVKHEYDGTRQRTIVEVHPYHNSYYRLKKLEREYDRDQAWFRKSN